MNMICNMYLYICIYKYIYIQGEFDHITSLDLPLKHSDTECLPIHYIFLLGTLPSNPWQSWWVLSTKKKHVFSSVFVQLRYSTLFQQKKTPTGVGKAGKPFQVQSSSLKGLFVRFKKLIVRDPWKQQWLYISLVSLVVNFPGKIIPPKWGFQW